MRVIGDLLDREVPIERAFARAHELKLDPSRRVVVAVVSFRASSRRASASRHPLTDAIPRAIVRELGEVVAGWYLEDLVCVVPNASCDQVEALLEVTLRSQPDTSKGVVVGIGSPGIGIAGIQRSHAEALEVIDILQAAALLPRVMSFAHCLPYRLLQQNAALAQQLIDASVGPLLSRRDGKLNVLLALVEVPGNLTEAAHRASVSRRSLYRHVRQIQTLTGLDLYDPRSLLLARLGVCAALLKGHELPTLEPPSSGGPGSGWGTGPRISAVAGNPDPPLRALASVAQRRRTSLRVRLCHAVVRRGVAHHAIARAALERDAGLWLPEPQVLRRTRCGVLSASKDLRRILGTLVAVAAWRVRGRAARMRAQIGAMSAAGSAHAFESIASIVAAAAIVGAISAHGPGDLAADPSQADHLANATSTIAHGSAIDLARAAGMSDAPHRTLDATLASNRLTSGPAGAKASARIDRGSHIKIGHGLSARIGEEEYALTEGPLSIYCDPASRLMTTACSAYEDGAERISDE